MKVPPLATLLSTFFLRYLAVERGVSPHTSTSYRDAIKLLLQFSAARCRRSVDQLVIEDLNAPVVLDFLSHLETSRTNTVRTRNARLAAVQTFFRYIAGQQPSLAALCSPVLAIPAKKALRPLLGYLSEQELSHLLAQVDRKARHGERDYVLLSVLYDTGARIQELLDLKPSDFHLNPPPFVRLRGKGRRERLCPLLPQSAQLVRKFLATSGSPYRWPRAVDTERARHRVGATRRAIHSAEVLAPSRQFNAQPGASHNQPAHIPPHQGHASSSVRRSARDGEGFSWPRRHEIHRSLCAGRPRNEAQGT